MAQPLKDMINARSVSVLADGLAAVRPAFPRARFAERAVAGLGPLELKDRVRHVSAALHDALPLPYPRAAELARACAARGELDLWSGWPLTDHTAVHGLGHLEEAMATLAAITPYSTGEFAVRPYLDRHRDDALKIMYGWAEPPGPRELDVIVNGRVAATVPFTLVEAAPAGQAANSSVSPPTV
ncbi:hypothetical protein ACIBIZ_26715 [Nonomuraea spiralis]|uniref:hypothetical protein n=1 Tax=Nonomuraea spiralis TaxID=46182 RepID=UPI00379A9570